MKTNTFIQTLKFIVLISNLPFIGRAQSVLSMQGPANIDTSRFVHIYFLRDNIDEFPDNWLAVIINDDEGFCVKAKMNSIYRVNTVLTGKTRLKTNIGNVKVELSLNLSAGKSYYVELKPKRSEDKSIVGDMKILDEKEGINRVQSFPNIIQNRYCIVPITGKNDFRENAWKDTIHWYASKKYEYYFMPLPSWEIILRSTLRTEFGFRNKLISSTYSEVGGILYLDPIKCTAEKEFENYCREEFIKSTLKNQRDSLISWEVKPVRIPSGIKYAKMVCIENRSDNEELSKDKPLFIRSVYVIFYWTDHKGNGITACLYTSERGLKEELHPISMLEERILSSWESFRLVKK